MTEGVGELYLSDVLDTSHFEKGFFNVIDAPCGSGKTTAAIERIAPLASSFDRAIYLIDTKLGKDRLSKEEKLTVPYKEYANDVSKHFFALENEGKICVTTYAQFGLWCYRFGLDLPDYFEYIICDEPQNLVNFSEIGQKDPDAIHVHRCARTAICRAVRNGLSCVVGITATSEPLKKLGIPMKTIPIDKTNLHHYTEREVNSYASFSSVLESIQIGQHGGIYVKHIRQLKEAGEILRARGHNPLMLWSLSNEDHPLSKEQLDAREFLITEERIPPEYDIFLFNATAETSINIRPSDEHGFKWDFFIANNVNETSITQSRGRYRGDLETLYVYEKSGAVIVPDDYLNRNLSMKEMGTLRDKLSLKKNKHGNPLAIPDMIVLLNDNGYNCEISWVNRKKTFKIIKA